MTRTAGHLATLVVLGVLGGVIVAMGILVPPLAWAATPCAVDLDVPSGDGVTSVRLCSTVEGTNVVESPGDAASNVRLLGLPPRYVQSSTNAGTSWIGGDLLSSGDVDLATPPSGQLIAYRATSGANGSGTELARLVVALPGPIPSTYAGTTASGADATAEPPPSEPTPEPSPPSQSDPEPPTPTQPDPEPSATDPQPPAPEPEPTPVDPPPPSPQPTVQEPASGGVVEVDSRQWDLLLGFQTATVVLLSALLVSQLRRP